MNKVILIGNLTKDPESFVSSSNIMRCSFTVAVNRPYMSGDGTRQTDFLPVVCWRKQAEICAKHPKKGSRGGLCGSVPTRTYDAQDGSKRYVTEIVADEVQFLSSRSEDSREAQELPEVQASRKPRIEDARPVDFQDDDDLPF